MHNFRPGDRVKVVKPSKTTATGPDTIIGNEFVVESLYEDDSLVLKGVHPYVEGAYRYVSAKAYRFASVE